MPTSKLRSARSIAPAAKSRASAKKPAAAKAKTSSSASAGKASPRNAKSNAATRPSRDTHEKRGATRPKGAGAKPVLLTGGNPQIAKADGDAPVQAYIAAMPGWKSDLGRRIDALIGRTVPGVCKAVRWNTPFYGVEGQGWFLGFNCLTKYVKVTFFRGMSLRPLPPGASKTQETRYLFIYEDDALDEKQLASWIKQAASIPGWDGGLPRNGGVPL